MELVRRCGTHRRQVLVRLPLEHQQYLVVIVEQQLPVDGEGKSSQRASSVPASRSSRRGSMSTTVQARRGSIENEFGSGDEQDEENEDDGDEVV